MCVLVFTMGDNFPAQKGKVIKYRVGVKVRGLCGYDNVEKTCSFQIQSNPKSKTHINPSFTLHSTNQTVGQES